MTPTFDRGYGILTLEATESTGGLLAQSNIMTAAGERCIDTLAPGDRIVTRDQGMVVLDDLRAREVDVPLVKIAARSLGHNRPEDDTVLPAGQRILVRDWRAQALFGSKVVLVPAERLVDGEFVTLQPKTVITVYDLLFDDPHILYVDGMEVASYIDDHAFF
ncbi:MAG: Hint domain-containing protein [Pseudomonadota bacterium]